MQTKIITLRRRTLTTRRENLDTHRCHKPNYFLRRLVVSFLSLSVILLLTIFLLICYNAESLTDKTTASCFIPTNQRNDILLGILPVEFSNVEVDTEEESLFTDFQYNEEVPKTVYLHIAESSESSSDFSWVPKVSSEKLSELDISVELCSSYQSSLEVSDTVRNYIYLITTRESGGEPFLGQLAVAEDVCNRIRVGGVYGSTINEILINGYEAEEDSSGILHFYNGTGEEILNSTESCRKAVDLALSGSDITSVLLEAVTYLQNERYGLQLDSRYFEDGATFHFAPKYLSNREMNARNIQRVPVAFAIENHIFYGYWHTSDNPLDITI